jgi:hypothetical protein
MLHTCSDIAVHLSDALSEQVLDHMAATRAARCEEAAQDAPRGRA